MKKLLLFIAVTLLCHLAALASHNRAGEITYRCLGGLTYEFTITTYTNTQGTTVDQCQLVLHYGDGDSTIAYRVNGGNNLCPAPARDGEIVAPNTKKNIYKAVHTYTGPASYTVWMQDPNRNAGILNMTNSYYVPFYLETTLVINPFLTTCNNSPVLSNMPLDFACTNNCFYHNPGAFDIDNDSLSYELVSCLEAPGSPVPNYTVPSQNGGGVISLDPVTGDLSWCSPAANATGEWNIAIKIKEWRKLGSQYILVGSVLRDMQITVLPCANNPPVIAPINDICVVAGDSTRFNVSASDPQQGPGGNVTLTATGGPFLVTPPASFIPSAPGNPASGAFGWQPGCDEIRTQPYLVSFKAEDSGSPVSLVDFETVMITVVGPAPMSVTASPAGSSMNISWSAPLCSPVHAYKIYRKNDCGPWTHSECETGVPAYTGYTQIGTVSGSTFAFTDNDGGQGLRQGIEYSYRVVAVYNGTVEGYSSEQSCARLVRDVPVITHADVLSTDQSNGSITVKWENPVPNAANFDTAIYPGPYKLRILRAAGASASFAAVDSVESLSFAGLTTRSHTSSGLNTQDMPYKFRLDFFAGAVYIGSTQTASSVYLTLAPSDNKISLAWEENVPWVNRMYYIYRQSSSPGSFVLIDSTTARTYIDAGLINGADYCYKIMSKGEYSNPAIIRPLLNNSEEMCASPKDLTAPCPPVLSVQADCETAENRLTWTNPNNYCADDVVKYNIYYAPVKGQPYSLLVSIPAAVDTSYLFSNGGSIAGCFAVTAVDTFNNESIYSNEFCVDNCPVYELPNVFTPDGDGKNDLFVPFPYRYVQDIDLRIFDRWGVQMFHTNDPDVRWNGTNENTNHPCVNGVYYYTCTVNEIRLDGVQPRVITGFVHIFQGTGGKPF